jgi:hypothetical protein
MNRTGPTSPPSMNGYHMAKETALPSLVPDLTERPLAELTEPADIPVHPEPSFNSAI